MKDLPTSCKVHRSRTIEKWYIDWEAFRQGWWTWFSLSCFLILPSSPKYCWTPARIFSWCQYCVCAEIPRTLFWLKGTFILIFMCPSSKTLPPPKESWWVAESIFFHKSRKCYLLTFPASLKPYDKDAATWPRFILWDRPILDFKSGVSDTQTQTQQRIPQVWVSTAQLLTSVFSGPVHRSHQVFQSSARFPQLPKELVIHFLLCLNQAELWSQCQAGQQICSCFLSFLGVGLVLGNPFSINPLDSKSREWKRLCLQPLREPHYSQVLSETPGLRLNQMKVCKKITVDLNVCGLYLTRARRFDFGAFIPSWRYNTIFHNT